MGALQFIIGISSVHSEVFSTFEICHDLCGRYHQSIGGGGGGGGAQCISGSRYITNALGEYCDYVKFLLMISPECTDDKSPMHC